MRNRWSARPGAAFLFCLAILLAAAPKQALAHAVLVLSTPQKNGAVSGPDLNISLKYNSRVDGGRSALSLLRPDGEVERISGLTQPSADTISAPAHGLTRGAWILRWQVLSGDGHITRGEVPFRVN